MSTGLTLSIDAMGGDAAPKMVIAGLNRLRNVVPQVHYLLFGRAKEIEPLLKRYKRLREQVEIRDTWEVVGSGDKPSQALRTGQNTSMRRAIDAVASGEAAGIVSAGNTGALMVLAKFVLKTLPGVDRPAIATLIPTRVGQSVILDLGANVECSCDNLVQFAVMGEVFARKVLRLDKPSVGLLNIGEEDLKGKESIKKAAAIPQDSQLAIRFHGFVEGNDIAEGTVDVFVTDGFSGNIALKTAEGTARLYSHFLREAFRQSFMARLGALLAGRALKRMRDKVDPRRYDGAMFLGLNGICVKSHGGTDSVGFANAVRTAIGLISDQVNEEIKNDFVCLYANKNGNSKRAAL